MKPKKYWPPIKEVMLIRKLANTGIIATTILLFLSYGSTAHTVSYDFREMTAGSIAWEYARMGFIHILPLGFDHILFILGIFLLQPRLKTVIWQATAFTVAHSVTLGLAIYGFIQPLPYLVEPIIALSIVFIAIENIFIKDLKSGRLLIVFLFGLIHGCGFAGALTEAGLPPENFMLALVSFNLGVEAGQLTVILLAFFLLGKWFMHREWYGNRIKVPLSIGIAAIGFYWTLERIFYS
jgi:hypothetical protein